MTYIPLNFFMSLLTTQLPQTKDEKLKALSLSQPNMMLGNLFGVYFTYILIGCDPKIGKNIFIFLERKVGNNIYKKRRP